MSQSPEEAARQLLLEDPNTAALAEGLGLAVDAYIEMVLGFVASGEAPQFFIVPDDQLRKMGHPVPDANEIDNFFRDAVATAMAHGSTGFDAHAKPSVSLGEMPAVTGTADPELKKQLDAQLRGKRGGNK